MLKKLLPHAAILLSNMMIVFFVLDRFNTAMGFIDNEITKWLILALSVISIANSVALISSARRAIRIAQRKRERQQIHKAA